MFFLFIFLITPPTGQIRTKITNLEDEIQAYKLLDRNKNQTEKSEKLQPDSSKKSENFLEPKIIKNSKKINEKISINKAVEIYKLNKNRQLFWNKTFIEISKD